jgi:hypothetical protein
MNERAVNCLIIMNPTGSKNLGACLASALTRNSFLRVTSKLGNDAAAKP